MRRRMLNATKKSPLFAKLKKAAPSICFSVGYTPDPHARWEGDSPDPGNDGFDAYVVTVSATAIVDGEEVQGEVDMGTYEKLGAFDPDIGGYLPQMIKDAAEDLMTRPRLSKTLMAQAKKAALILKTEMRKRYDRQMKGRK